MTHLQRRIYRLRLRLLRVNALFEQSVLLSERWPGDNCVNVMVNRDLEYKVKLENELMLLISNEPMYLSVAQKPAERV